MPAIALIVGLVGVAIGVLGALFVQQYVRRNRVEAAERSAARILNEADRRQKARPNKGPSTPAARRNQRFVNAAMSLRVASAA